MAPHLADRLHQHALTMLNDLYQDAEKEIR